MVQIIQRARSTGDKWGEAFGALGETLGQKIPEELMGRAERAQLSELLGQDVSNIRNPDMQKIFAQMGMQQKAKQQEFQQKVNRLEAVKKTPFWEQLNEAQRGIVEAELLGDLSAQSAKSLHNLEREREQRNDFAKWSGYGNQIGNSLQNQMPSEMFLGAEGQEPGFDWGEEEFVTNRIQPAKTGKEKKGLATKSDAQLRLDQANPNPMISNAAKAELEERRREQDLGLKKEERNYKRNEKFLNRIDESAKGIRKMDLALSQMDAMVNSGDYENWQNILGEITGQEYLKTASAQVGNAATKEFLMGGLSDITGRPNQFLEKSLTQAVTNPQYKKEANIAILDGLKIMQDLRKKEIEITSDLEDYYTENIGEIPRNFQKLVREQMDAYAEPVLKNYEKHVKSLLSKKKDAGMEALKIDEVLMIDPQGQKRAVSKKDVEAAKQAGYQLQS